MNFEQDLSIAIIAAILGISLPLLIQSIVNIDSKYESWRLTNRLKKSTLFRSLIGLLIAILGYRLYYCFLPERCYNSQWPIVNDIIDNSGWIILYGLLIALVTIMILFCYKVLLYYNPNRLIKEIPNGLKNSGDTDSCYYADWRELILVMLYKYKHKSEDTLSIAHEELYQYAIEKNIDNENQIVEYSTNFYDALRSINKGICQVEKQMSSTFNASTSTNILIDGFQNTRISDTSYKCIWLCLQEQLFYNREDLVYDYWKSAYQHFSFNLKSIFDSDEYDKKENREVDIKRFRLFNCMLGAIIYDKDRGQLLKQIFNYSNSTYQLNPLLPDSYTDIIPLFAYVNEKSLYNPIFFETYFPVLNVDSGVYTGLIIKQKLDVFLALLIVRVYKIKQSNNSNYRANTSMPSMPETAAENRVLNSIISDIITLLSDNKELFDSYFDIDANVLSEFKKYSTQLDANYDRILSEQTLDSNLIDEIYDNIKTGYSNFVNKLDKFSKPKEDSSHIIKYPITYKSKEKKEKRIFCGNQEYSTSGLAEIYQSIVFHNLALSFGYFLLDNASQSIICLYDDIREVLNRLSLSKDKHIIIASNINLLDLGLDEVGEYEYTYNEIQIISFNNTYLTNIPCVWVIEKNSLPYLSKDVTLDNLTENDKKSDGVYVKIIDLNQEPENSKSSRKYCNEVIECGLTLCFAKDLKLLRIPLVYQYQQAQYTSLKNISEIDTYIN